VKFDGGAAILVDYGVVGRVCCPWWVGSSEEGEHCFVGGL